MELRPEVRREGDHHRAQGCSGASQREVDLAGKAGFGLKQEEGGDPGWGNRVNGSG